MAKLDLSKLRVGVRVELDGEPFIITQYQHVKPGKGPAYVQAKMMSVANGSVSEKRFRTAGSVEQAVLDRRVMQFLYTDASGHVFMDNETYDQIPIAADLLGDAMLYVKANTDIKVLCYEDKPISIELPISLHV